MRKLLFAAATFLAVGTSAFAQTPVLNPPPGMTRLGDKHVWVTPAPVCITSKGERYFGSTKQGQFMCEHDADREGDRPTRNGQ